MKGGKWQKLKIKVGGDTVKIMQGTQDKDAQFLDKMDREFSAFNDVFRCLSEIDKSLYPDWEKHIAIYFQCHGFCLSKKFCQKVISFMEAELTEQMELETRIDTAGFVDYGR